VVGFEEGCNRSWLHVVRGTITASDEWWEEKIAVSKTESCLFFYPSNTSSDN
jgi:hypothetical protein